MRFFFIRHTELLSSFGRWSSSRWRAMPTWSAARGRTWNSTVSRVRAVTTYPFWLIDCLRSGPPVPLPAHYVAMGHLKPLNKYRTRRRVHYACPLMDARSSAAPVMFDEIIQHAKHPWLSLHIYWWSSQFVRGFRIISPTILDN